MPIQKNLNSYVKKEANVSFGVPHVITRTLKYLDDSGFFYLNNLKSKRRHVRSTKRNLTIEMAVFVDEVAYNSIFSFLDEDDEKMSNIILAYVNGIQAVFHYPSLGVSIDISLVRVEIMEKQPSDLPNRGGEAISLLNTFYNYATSRNPLNDDNPHHWDIALYITGLNLYTKLNNKVNYGTMGMGYVGAICKKASCAIVEFGTNLTTKSPLSNGFTSIYIAAHEIGHV